MTSRSDAYTLKTRTLRSGASKDEIARAVDRHDRVTSPERLRESHERARQWSPDHHAYLDAHKAVMDSQGVLPDQARTALYEASHAQQQGEQARQQAAQDAYWQRYAVMAQGEAQLGMIKQLGARTTVGYLNRATRLPTLPTAPRFVTYFEQL